MERLDKVVVVTGASSGIGRATANALAEAGCSLVLAARSEERLDEVEQECVAKGAKVLAVATDVGVAADVARLSMQAIEAFGQFDVWVNNAGVTAFGRIEDIPAADHARIITTNLIGTIFGAREAIIHFKAIGGGTLINISSLVSEMAAPFQVSYAASKWGSRGLGNSLRAELNDFPQIHVCTVKPGFIDSGIFENAANYTEHPVQPVDPVYAPENVAETVVNLIRRPENEVFVGDASRLQAMVHKFSPALAGLAGKLLIESRGTGEGYVPPRQGNLHEPSGTLAVRGGWAERGFVQGERNDAILRGVGLGALGLLALTIVGRGLRGRM